MDLLLLAGRWCGWLNGLRGGKGANKVAGARSFYQDIGGRINRKNRRKDTPEESGKMKKSVRALEMGTPG